MNTQSVTNGYKAMQLVAWNVVKGNHPEWMW